MDENSVLKKLEEIKEAIHEGEDRMFILGSGLLLTTILSQFMIINKLTDIVKNLEIILSKIDSIPKKEG